VSRSAGRVLRWLPFVLMAGISLWVAAGLPHVRRPFRVDLSLSPEALAFSVAKVKHYQSTVLFFILATVAVGVRRTWTSFWLVMALGVAWELAEATALRHTARVADLVPDLLAAVLCVAVLAVARHLVAGCREGHPSSAQNQLSGPALSGPRSTEPGYQRTRTWWR
jgi:hypothetical protein